MDLPYDPHALILLVLFLISLSSVVNTLIVCPATRHNEVSVHVTFEGTAKDHNVTDAFVKKDDVIVIFCHLFHRCHVNPLLANYTLNETISRAQHHLTITAESELQDEWSSPEGLWSLQYADLSKKHLKESCYLSVNNHFNAVYCTYTAYNCTGVVLVTCSADRFYPNMQCVAFLNSSLTSVNIIQKVAYEHVQLSSRCHLQMYVQSPSAGQYSLTIAVYPDVSRSVSDSAHGRNISITLDIVYGCDDVDRGNENMSSVSFTFKLTGTTREPVFDEMITKKYIKVKVNWCS